MYLPHQEGRKAELTLGYPTMHRPGVEPAISRSQVQRPNHYTNGAISYASAGIARAPMSVRPSVCLSLFRITPELYQNEES